MKDNTPKRSAAPPESQATGIKSLLMVGPRGIRGFFGWTFFDPANLVTIVFMSSAALLAVLSMRARGAADWYMPLGLYVSLAAFLRGYFFAYYHGNALSRVTTLLIFLLGTLLSGALWEERAPAREVLRASGIFNVSEAPGFHFAAILHLAAASTILIHFILPRHWLIQMTDQVVETAGLERSLEEKHARHQASRAPKPLDAESAPPDLE